MKTPEAYVCDMSSLFRGQRFALLCGNLRARKNGSSQLVEMKIPEAYVCDMSSLFIGQKFASGNYTVLYHGVYKDQEVAIKLLNLKMCKDATVATKLENEFMNEVQVLSQLRHPHIVTFLAASYQPPVCCLVTEYLPRGSLRTFLNTIKPGLSTILSMALDIAVVMEYLHSRGVVHRDLKSQNLVVTEDLRLKLIDFGTACWEDESCESVSAAEFGTYRYMAPEMLGARKYSTQVDVYSFGIVLWEIVTGKLPFHDLNPEQVAFAVVNKNARPSVPVDCPSGLQQLMQRCWNANPAKRPSFNQIVHILKNLEKYSLSEA